MTDNTALALSPEAQAFEAQRQTDEAKRQQEAREVAAKHRDATGGDAPDAESAGTLANHRAQLDVLNTEVNEATSELMKFAADGESLEDVAARGTNPATTNPALSKAAARAINAHTAMDLQTRAAADAQAEIDAGVAANEFKEMRHLRKQELRSAARKLAAEEKISLADAFQLVLLEIQVDGVEHSLPSFAKVTKRMAAKYAADVESA